MQLILLLSSLLKNIYCLDFDARELDDDYNFIAARASHSPLYAREALEDLRNRDLYDDLYERDIDADHDLYARSQFEEWLGGLHRRLPDPLVKDTPRYGSLQRHPMLLLTIRSEWHGFVNKLAPNK